jgi:GAF domain-containing protein
MFAPLIAGDRIIGSLNVKSFEPDAYSSQNVALFEQLATQIGGSVRGGRALLPNGAPSR